MLSAILFDLDGTLVNTDPFHFRAWQETLRNYDLEIDTAFYQTRISGRLNPVIVRDLLPHLSPEEGEQLADNKEARFRELAPLLQPLAGLDRLLFWIKKQGLKIALVTNAPRKNVDFMLSVLKLKETFPTVILAEDLKAGKPDPAPYQFALELLNVHPEDAIAFEDSPSGIRSSVGAGIFTIGIASTHDPLVLEKAGANKVIVDFTDEFLADFLTTKIGNLTVS